jgi:hypothetical protein
VAHEILAAMTGDAERDRAVLQGPPTDSETSPA